MPFRDNIHNLIIGSVVQGVSSVSFMGRRFGKAGAVDDARAHAAQI